MSDQGRNPLVIIQARMASTRLPGKMMMSLAGKTLVDWVVDSAKALNNAKTVVVATTTNEEDTPLVKHVEKLGVSCFRGSSEDVLDRFYNAAMEYEADPIIRLCADSPLVSSQYMDQMIEHHIQTNSDLTHAGNGAPLGAAGEVISFAALKTAHENAKNDYQREHVTPYIQEHSAQFKITVLTAPDWLTGGYRYRLTIDEKPDFEMFEMLLQELKANGLKCGLKNAVTILNERPDIAAINQTVIQKNWRHPTGGSNMLTQ